jgi:hypothetical protein
MIGFRVSESFRSGIRRAKQINHCSPRFSRCFESIQHGGLAYDIHSFVYNEEIGKLNAELEEAGFPL